MNRKQTVSVGLLIAAVVMFTACESPDAADSHVSGAVYHDFADPWYYGEPYYLPPGDVDRPPLDRPVAPHPENPIVIPPGPSVSPRPMPSIPSMPRPSFRR